MYSSVFLAQVVGFMNSGDASESYKDVIRVGRDMKLKSDEFELLLDSILDVPPALKISEKKSTPVIVITTGKSKVQMKNDGMKEWSRFRRLSCFNRRLVNALEDVLTEDPKEEAMAFEKAWENSGAKVIDGPEQKNLLQAGVTGLWGFPGSDVWAPKPSEIHHAPDFWSSTDSQHKEVEQSSFNYKPEVLMEDPRQEPIDWQKAWESNGPIDPSGRTEQVSSLFPQPGVTGLWEFSDSAIWIPKPTEAVNASGDYLMNEVEYSYGELASPVKTDPYYEIYWDNFVNYHVNLCFYTLDSNLSLYMQSDPYLVLSFPITLAHFLSI